MNPSLPKTRSVVAEAQAKLYLARAWHLKRNMERAIGGYREVIALQPQGIQPYHLLGSLLMAENRLVSRRTLYPSPSASPLCRNLSQAPDGNFS